MKFIVDNLLDSAVSITANDEDSFFPVTNISVKTLADKYQSSTAGSKEIQIVLDDVYSITEVAVCYHNLDSGDELILESYPDVSGFAGTPIQQQLTIRDGIIYLGLDNEVFHETRYYKLLIEKNSGSYAHIGFLMLAIDSFYAPHRVGTVPGFETNSTKTDSQGLQGYPSIKETRNVQPFEFTTTRNEWYKLYTMMKIQKFFLIPGIILQTHKNLDKWEPYFGNIKTYNSGSVTKEGYYKYSIVVEEDY